MGSYDDIPADRLEADLASFARLILQLEAEGELLRSIPEIQQALGELRQKLFAFEVRMSRHLGGGESPTPARDPSPPVGEDPVLRDSIRVVREALRREAEMLREWEGEDTGRDADDE